MPIDQLDSFVESSLDMLLDCPFKILIESLLVDNFLMVY